MIALLPHCGFLSETTRMLAIARALRAAGESVALASHGGPYSSVLDAAGEPWSRLAPAMDDARCRGFLRDLVRIGQPGVRMQPADEVRASVESEAAFLRGIGARMVVIGFTLTAYLSARVVGIPLATSHGGSYVPPIFERGLAPVPTTMPMPFAEWLPAALKRRIANAGPERLTGPTRFLNEVAAELGVEPVPTLAALMLGDLTLVTELPEVLGLAAGDLERWRPARPAAHRRDPRLAAVGPLYARLDLPVPPPVEALLDGRRPTALVVLSSSTPEMLRAVVARVRASGARVVVGATIHDIGPVDDPDVVVAGILPNHLVMPRVDVAVTMGGQGTVQTAMASGTPLVAIPLHPEQELNVGLAARQGMAIPLAPRHAGTARMTEAVQRITADPAYATAARRVRDLYAGTDGASRAAAAILSFVGRPASAARDDARVAIRA